MTKRPLCLVCLFLILFLVTGDWLGFPFVRGNPLPDHLKEWIKEHPEGVICGEVKSFRDTEFSQTVSLKEAYLIYKSKKIPIKNITVYLKKREELKPGMYLCVRGVIEELPLPRNPGEFNARQYYACEHMYYSVKKGVVLKKGKEGNVYQTFLLQIREYLNGVLEQTAGEAAPVFSAMVLGEKGELPKETKMRYQMAGIIHILAISGLHISLLGMGFYELLKKAGIGIWGAGFLSLIVMIFYGEMTGESVSAMRAVSMFLIATGAKILGRIYDMMTALSVSAMILLLESPAYLYSTGFLLSFGAVLGVGAVLPVFFKFFGVKNKILKSFMGSVCVQLTTLPVMLWFYGEASVIGIFLNLLVLPTVGIVLVSGVFTALIGCVFPGLAVCIAIPGRLMLFAYDKLCRLGASLTFSTWTPGKPEIWQVVIYYVFLFLLTESMLFFLKKQIKNVHTLRAVKGGVLAILTLVLFVLSRRDRQYMEITCLDIGQGDAIAAHLPTGEVFLVDGGSSNKKNIGQYQLLPFLKNQGISYVNAVFISHTDKDHISGVREILEYMEKGLISLKIGNLILPGISEKPEAWKELKCLAEKAGIQVYTANEGDAFRIGEGEISVLSPEKGALGENVNEDAVVFLFSYKDFHGLFTGDIGEETEKKLLPVLSDVDFLKVGHHGSGYSSSQAFLDKIKPEVSIISCSKSNTYGHPSPETIKRLEKSGSRVEYTMKSGAVTVFTDGKKVGIRCFFPS